ncbi:hypothetical protein V0288_00390 [Pannus brasiliensis CCIBt3594]|uniref:Uncharacterized protein n=1 Tax=Pannus brasiliensis CCIBt3594 TaxID=1427578 RepID=A0AAW9QRU6_9CHRO
MPLQLQYDKINWNDPELIETLKRYRETIDSSSPLVKSIDKAFTPEEKIARQKAYFAVLEKYKV